MKIEPLIYNSDIIALKKKASSQNLNALEANIIRHEGWNEHKVQFAAKNFFGNLSKELEMQGIGQVFFFQIDNGANNLTIGAKVRKWQEGTVAKMPDAGILVFCIKTGRNKAWFCEFKKVDTEKAIKGNPNCKTGLKIYLHYQAQLKMHEKLRKMNFPVHLTNNLAYCEYVIAKEIREFLENR